VRHIPQKPAPNGNRFGNDQAIVKLLFVGKKKGQATIQILVLAPQIV
jgi:hypothetical protein